MAAAAGRGAPADKGKAAVAVAGYLSFSACYSLFSTGEYPGY